VAEEANAKTDQQAPAKEEVKEESTGNTGSGGKIGAFFSSFRKDKDEGSNPKEQEDVEETAAILMKRTIFKFQMMQWVGSVQIKATLSGPGFKTEFYLSGGFGFVSNSVSATTDQKQLEAASEKEAEDEKQKGFWERRLSSVLNHAKKRVEKIAFGLKDFRMYGQIGCIFHLGAPPLLPGQFSAEFELKLAFTIESVIAWINSEYYTMRETQELERKARKKLQKKQELQQSIGFLLPSCLKKKMQDNNDQELTEAEKAAKEDATVKKMVLALQATKLRARSLGWQGFAKAQVDLGLISFWIQISFFKSVTRLALDVESVLVSSNNNNNNNNEKSNNDKSSDGSAPVVTRVPSSSSLLIGSRNNSSDGSQGSQGSQATSWVTGRKRNKTEIEREAKRKKEEEEMKRLLLMIEEERQVDDAAAADTTLADGGGTFTTGLEMGINRIQKLSARYAGIYNSIKVGASFNFNILGFGVQTSMEVEAISVRTFS
jgi:hypothetical protein